MEIDIKAPLEAVLEYIAKHDFLGYSIDTDRNHNTDNNYYQFDWQNYEPLPKIKPALENAALESYAEPIVVNTRDGHANVCTTVSSDLVMSPKNPAALLPEDRRQQQSHLVEYIGSVMMKGFSIKKTKVYKLCMDWGASAHPSNPQEWTEITLSFFVAHSFDERMRQLLYRRRQEIHATNINESLVKKQQEYQLLQDVIVNLVLQRETHPLLLVTDVILHWVKQISESSNGSTVKREITDAIQQKRKSSKPEQTSHGCHRVEKSLDQALGDNREGAKNKRHTDTVKTYTSVPLTEKLAVAKSPLKSENKNDPTWKKKGRVEDSESKRKTETPLNTDEKGHTPNNKKDTTIRTQNIPNALQNHSTNGETILSGSVTRSGQKVVRGHDNLTPLFETMESIKITVEERFYLISTLGALILCNVYLCCRPRKRYSCA